VPVLPAAPPRPIPGDPAGNPWWQLLSDDTSVTAVTAAGTVAEARVSEPDERVVIELWAGTGDLAPEAAAALVARAFALPAVRPRRPVLVCVPRRDVAVLAQAHRHVRDDWTRAAGATSLIEGLVDADPPAAVDDDLLPTSAGCVH
jgi:hypothetical protein